MPAYNITLSDGVSVLTIADSTIDNQTDIPLIGQNATTFGDDVATALLRLLENFANSSAPNFGSQSLPNTGQFWFDTTGAKKKLKVWDGSTWVAQLRENENLSIVGNINPSVDSTYNLGESSTPLRWLAIHGDNITAAAALQGDTVIAVTTLTSSGITSFVDAVTTGATTGTLSMGAGSLLTTAASIAGTAGVNIPPGAVPTAPADGDFWTTAAGMFARVNGSTNQLNSAAGSNVTSFETRQGVVTALTTDYDTFYPELSGTETITGGYTFTTSRPAFDSTGAPFTVTSSTVVANLNADLLDGNDSSFYTDDSTAVHVTGVESIAGVKTLTDQLIVDNSIAEAIRINGTGSGSSNTGYMSIRTDDGSTEQARIGITSSSNNNVVIDAMASGASTELYGAGVKGIDVSSATVTLNYGGSFRLFTQDISGVEISGLGTMDANTITRRVGFNETREFLLTGPSQTISEDYVGGMIRKANESNSMTITINTISLPEGSAILINHDYVSPGATTMVIAEGSIDALEWIDGNGGAPLTGNRTIAQNSLVTLRLKSLSGNHTWQIWGTGIS